MLIIHSDVCVLPDQARKVHALLADSKDLYWSNGDHFDFYDQVDLVREAVDRAAAH